MKQLTDSQIVEALELLAQHFQWQKVSLEIYRSPDGTCHFQAAAHSDSEKGFEYTWGSGETPMAAVQEVMGKVKGAVIPEQVRDAAIRKLEAQLEKLKALTFGMPPYRPGCYLPEHAGEVIEISA